MGSSSTEQKDNAKYNSLDFVTLLGLEMLHNSVRNATTKVLGQIIFYVFFEFE